MSNPSEGGGEFTQPAAAGGSGGIGDVVGPGSATDGAFALFDGATGKLIKDSAILPASKADAVYTIRAHTGTSDTLVLADAGKLVTSSNASAVTQTIPANASVAFAIGTVITSLQLGSGQVSYAITSDTLRLPSGFVAKCRGQYSTVTFTKIASTEWVASGDLAFV